MLRLSGLYTEIVKLTKSTSSLLFYLYCLFLSSYCLVSKKISLLSYIHSVSLNCFVTQSLFKEKVSDKLIKSSLMISNI